METLIPAPVTAFTIVWRSNSIPMKTGGIRAPMTVVASAMWRSRAAALGPNTSHHGYACSTADGAPNSTIAQPIVVKNLSDGMPHNVTITYTPAKGQTPANIHVILDTVDIFGAVNTDLSSIGLGAGNTAYVGFTAATGGQDQDQDIANWTYMPGSQSGVITMDTPLTLPFQGGPQNNAYDYTALAYIWRRYFGDRDYQPDLDRPKILQQAGTEELPARPVFRLPERRYGERSQRGFGRAV